MPGRLVPWFHRRVLFRWWAPLLAYMLLAILLSVSLYVSSKQDARTVADSSRAGCARTNVLRDVVGSLLETAERARRTPPLEPGDLAAATRYHRLEERLAAAAVAGLDHTARDGVYTVDCESAFPRP